MDVFVLVSNYIFFRLVCCIIVVRCDGVVDVDNAVSGNCCEVFVKFF